jgi:ABC-2 type transport system permease protein
MQPRQAALPLIRRIAGKELTLFFASPIAWLFLASFAALTLFVFFWGEAFFARNIADVRPMFEWMPLLLIFLCSTLTMRLWSEERRSGTLEHVLTQPVPLWQFVLGKFVGCLALLLVALAVTLPLPLTVAVLGDLDWGPVLAGYIATFLLGAAYLSIGLFVSARADNQIVSLIAAVALCGVFWIIGNPLVTNFFGNDGAQLLRQLGTGARFDDITRGVLDLRDLYYYLSLIGCFLALNVFTLEQERWALQGDRERHLRYKGTLALLLLNIIGANLWLGQLGFLRADTTEGRQYSISEATRSYLAQLQEPLLLRGYFSAKTHPLLAPLVPQLQDLLQEYEIAGRGRVRVELIDPLSNPEAEEEANRQFGIEPVPFQVADRYQSAIVSSYFNVLVKYGDEYKVLGFDDFIEVKSSDAATEIQVELRNPEHDLTRAIRGVLNSYQAAGNLFDTVREELTLTAYVSPDEALPERLREFRSSVEEVANSMAAQSGGRFTLRVVDPEAGDGSVATQLGNDYGLRAMTTSLFGGDRFWFYLLLDGGDQLLQIPLDDMSQGSFERNLKAAIQRFSTGFTKTVGVVSPRAGGMSFMPGGGAQFSQLRSLLGAELSLVDEDLSDGSVAGNVDLLLLLAPENLDEKAVFAVDQFLMQGGTVIAATSPFAADLSGNSLSLRPVTSGLQDWLQHHGISMEQQLVMDSRNSAFPIPVTRNVGGFALREWRLLDYPWFPDLRGDSLNREHPITADLPQLTLAWSSPLTLDSSKQGERSVTPLLKSSAGAWLSASTNVVPNIDANGNSHYEPGDARGEQLLGLVMQGSFSSYFAERESPLLAAASGPEADAAAEADEAAEAEAAAAEDDAAAADPVISSVITRSPESARLIVLASNDFLQDQVLQLLGTASNTEYLNPLQLVANSIDWSLEDAGLLSIRGRGHFNRTLPPMERDTQILWETLNYVLAALAIGLIALLQRRIQRARAARWQQLLAAQ